MLPYFEQSPMYNAVNFSSGTSAAPDNLTIAGVQVNSLICPSDTRNEQVAFPAARSLHAARLTRLELECGLPLAPWGLDPSVHQLWRKCRYVHIRLLKPDADVGPRVFQWPDLQ